MAGREIMSKGMRLPGIRREGRWFWRVWRSMREIGLIFSICEYLDKIIISLFHL